MKNKIIYFLTLLSFTLIIQNVSGLTNLLDSDLYDGKQQFSDLTLEFAVYDSTTSNGQNFESRFGTVPGVGKYIYAYQVFTTFEINFFALYDTEQTSWSDDNYDDNNIGALDSQDGGIEPGDAYFGQSSDVKLGTTIAIWDFWEDPIGSGERSWLMVYRSDNTFKTTGKFTLDPEDNDIGIPIVDIEAAEIPEPATWLIFACAAVVLRGTKKSKRI